MEDAVTVATAKAVIDYIEDADIEMNYVLQRSYAEWDLELSATDTLEVDDANILHIDVVVHTTEQEVELAAQKRARFDVPIDIAVRKKMQATHQDASTGRVNVEEVDVLMKLTEDLHQMFMPQRLPEFDCASWLRTQVIVAPERRMLREFRQFTSIIRVVFRADRKLSS